MMHRIGAWAVVGVLALVLGGCAANEPLDPNWVRSNMSPELKSTAHTSQELKNVHARTFDTSLRQVYDDIDYIMLFDRPIRLSKYPIP